MRRLLFVRGPDVQCGVNLQACGAHRAACAVPGSARHLHPGARPRHGRQRLRGEITASFSRLLPFEVRAASYQARSMPLRAAYGRPSLLTGRLLSAAALHPVQDEDFVCHTFGIRLDMPGVRDPAAAALAELGLAEERLQALQEQQHARKPGRTGDDVEAEGVAIRQHLGAFLARVRFRKALLKVRAALPGDVGPSMRQYWLMSCASQKGAAAYGMAALQHLHEASSGPSQILKANDVPVLMMSCASLRGAPCRAW